MFYSLHALPSKVISLTKTLLCLQTNYTLACFLLLSCVQVSHVISFSCAFVPQPSWKRMNLTNRLALAELVLLLIEGLSHRHVSVPQRLVSISATFFFLSSRMWRQMQSCRTRPCVLGNSLNWNRSMTGNLTSMALSPCLLSRSCVCWLQGWVYSAILLQHVSEVWFCPQMLKVAY